MRFQLDMHACRLILIAFFVLSCGAAPTPDAVRLSGWVSSPAEENLLASTLEGFRQAHPDIAVKYEPIPGSYSEKIQLMLGTHTAPDVFYLKGEIAPSYIRYQVLRPLNDYVSRDSSFAVDDFFPLLRQAFMQDTVYYGFPKDFNVYALFYNPEMFAAAGLEQPPQNWSELETVATRLTRDHDNDGKTDQWGLVIEPTIEMIMPFVFQNGGQFHNEHRELQLTDTAFVEAVEFYYGLYGKGIAALPTDVGASWNGDAFGRRRCAMIYAGAWAIPFLKETYPQTPYQVAFLPAGKKRATIAFTTAYVVPQYCKKPEQAWTVLGYLTGKAGMAKWTSLGLALPSRRSVAQAGGFYEHPIFKYFVGSADFARPFQVAYNERWYDESQAAVQSIFFKQVAPAEALATLQRRLKKYKI